MKRAIKDHPKNLLVIDPDKEFSENVRLFMEQDYHVDIRQSLEHMDRTIILRRIDLVVIDAEYITRELLPLLKDSRLNHPGLKIIIMYTYLPDDKNLERGLIELADDVIAKPFNVDVLKEKIDHLLLLSKSSSFLH